MGDIIVTKAQLKKVILDDKYNINRISPNDAELRLYLREVDFHCPLCGKELQYRKQKKPTEKLFEIAHIYPNSPTIEQYEALHNLERLGLNSEDYDNKIALCLECHNTQDYHTTAEEYLHLVEIKKGLLKHTAMDEAVKSLSLEEEIRTIINKLCTLSESEIAQLNYDPIPIPNKFDKGDTLLKIKISGYIQSFYVFIRDIFRENDGINGFHLDILAGQIKACFIKLNDITDNKAEIFKEIVQWISNKTLSQSIEACEAVVSFFVQNCEVFYEIAQ